MEDEHGYGAGNSRKTKKWDKSTSKKQISEVVKKSTRRLTESDPDYPKDVPRGAPHYEKFWREELREVMNQGSTNICWNVASSGSLSSRLRIEKKVKTLKRLSLLHNLVGLFAKTGDKGELKDLGHLKKFLEEEGSIMEKDCKCSDPLMEMRRKNTNDKSKIKKPVLCTHSHDEPKSVFKVKELIVLDKVVEEDLILLLDKGPVAISISNNLEFIRFKGDGIYDWPKKYTKDLGLHMLLCTGYGTLNGVHYWDVQNSAGTSWGNGGFGKIIRQTSSGNGKPSFIKAIVYPLLLEDYNDED